MAHTGISEEVKQFIFEFIDSVEQLEVLLLLRKKSDTKFSPQSVSDELRSSPGSADLRLHSLEAVGFVSRNTESEYCYSLNGSEIDVVIGNLEETYRLKPHKILELIFSPMKKARGFAEAFVVKRRKNEDNNG